MVCSWPIEIDLAERWPADDHRRKGTIFLFGVFELLVWQKKFKVKNNLIVRQQS